MKQKKSKNIFWVFSILAVIFLVLFSLLLVHQCTNDDFNIYITRCNLWNWIYYKEKISRKRLAISYIDNNTR
ncbi:Uncharacterised protein [Staphylococcus aureus]|uniref:Uncharacterized protein n=1 Tax=Staphylococcus aureus TaxID=1280 RepID=A0A2X2MDP8_STAAU|nr:Uncharacterised protein [Staphylococcus aureus]